MSIYQDHRYKHAVGWNTWHFQSCIKYRYRFFADTKLQKLCGIFLHEIAKRHNFKIENLEIDADHVRLKSFYWRGTGKRSLWGDGKFISSIGHITLEKAKDYVENHRTYDAKDFTSLTGNPRPLGLGRMLSPHF